MKTANIVLMKKTRESLKGRWGFVVWVFFVFTIIISALTMIPVAGSIISLIISGPFILGLAIFSLSVSRNQEAHLEQIFEGFKHFGQSLVTYLLVAIFVLLWSLLLIIPGIIAAISYSMTFYIMADDRSIRPMDALNKSKKMMYGYKAKFFRLQLRFFLWGLLCLLTLGIGFLWLIPWMQVTIAKFYDEIKDNLSSTTESSVINNSTI